MNYLEYSDGALVFGEKTFKGNINHCIAELYIHLFKGGYDTRTIRKIKLEAKQLLKESE